MPKRIDVGKEIIEFPDGMPDSEIEKVLKQQFPPEKPRPTAASRFLENTVKPIEAVSDSIQASMRSQNPIGDLASKAANVVGGVVRDPMGTVKAIAQPFVNVGSDLMNGDVGAAAGGLTGLALPFLPRGVKAAAKVDRAATMAATKGTVTGAVNGGVGALLDSTRKPVTVVDVLIPGAKKAKMGAEAASGIYQGAKAGRQQAMTALELQRRQAANPPRMPVTVEPVVDAPVDASPIPGDLPSGRRPMTRAEREAKYGAPLPKPDMNARVSGPVEAATAERPMTRGEKAVRAVDPKSPEGIAMMQELAAELNPLQTPKGKGPDFIGGSRAKKVWNFSDELNKQGITAESLPDINPQVLLKHLNQLNKDIYAEWVDGGMKGKKPNIHHVPSTETLKQLQQELREIEARKANNQ
jgi:hypothetical protein